LTYQIVVKSNELW